uniref:RNI-like superfamily protein n=1 Tax=Oryza rufipogon TaxID=4529 RepID=A0A0E0Q1N6_ORYRU
MEKGKSVVAELAASLRDVEVTPRRKPANSPTNKARPRKLVSLCLGILGQHLEDIITDISEFSTFFPPHIKLAILSIARRRRLLNDEVLISLADSSWEILDISGSDVSDIGLATVANISNNLWAIDISRCERITAAAVSEVICHCPSLEILRCGGCPGSESTARRSVYLLKPKLNTLEEDSWEELDTVEIGGGAESLRWLVWPKIDDNSKEIISMECPRITVNPQPSPFDLRGHKVPAEALASVPLDHSIIADIDPKTWAVAAAPRRPTVPTNPNAPPEIPIAEKFRLAYVEREARLAPKRAKRERQQRRRAEREYLMNDINAKSVALAAQPEESVCQCAASISDGAATANASMNTSAASAAVVGGGGRNTTVLAAASFFRSGYLGPLTAPRKCGTPAPSPAAAAAVGGGEDGGSVFAGGDAGTATAAAAAADRSERAMTLESRSRASAPGRRKRWWWRRSSAWTGAPGGEDLRDGERSSSWRRWWWQSMGEGDACDMADSSAGRFGEFGRGGGGGGARRRLEFIAAAWRESEAGR